MLPNREMDVDTIPGWDGAVNAFDDEERENLAIDDADLILGWFEEDIDMDEPTPRSDEAEFLITEFDDDCRLLWKTIKILLFRI